MSKTRRNRIRWSCSGRGIGQLDQAGRQAWPAKSGRWLKVLASGLIQWLWMLLALVFSTSGQGQSLNPGLGEPGCQDPASTMLWEVRGGPRNSEGLTLYLFGSIHVGKPDLYPLPAVVENLVSTAQHLVFEIDPRTAADPQVAGLMQRRGLLPAGQSLDQLVSPRTLQDLGVVMDSLNIPLVNFMALKPWMITLMLANLQVNALGFDAQWGLESYFMSRRSPDSQILELESLQSQVDMLDSLDPEAFLGYSLREYEASAGTFEQLMQAWRCADHEQLEQVMFDADSGAALSIAESVGAQQLQDQLFTQRNQVMASGIQTLLQQGQGSYFVVVGAGHLLGDDSVTTLLQEQGYTVAPVRQPLL